MTRTKKPAPKRTRSPARRSSASSSSRSGRFARALFLSCLASFGGATYLLNSPWREQLKLDHVLAQLGWPAHQNAPARHAGIAQHQPAASAPAAGPVSTVPIAAPKGDVVQTTFVECKQFFPAQRTPVVPAASSLRELCFSSFAILHNGATKTPVVVVEKLNRDILTRAQGMKRSDKFYAEARVPRAERAELGDYKGSGYSRGHMAPAGDMATNESMAQSFSLANMVPQDQRHNGGAWSQIEQDTRKYVMRASGDVYVYTGPVYGAQPKRIGSGVAVPVSIFKVVYDASTGKSWVHWQDNSPTTKAGPPISYAEFVKRTGMHLLPPA